MFGENVVELTGEGPWTIKIGDKTYKLELNGTLYQNTVRALAQLGTIQLWDRVNYDPGSETTANISLPDGASLLYYDETNEKWVKGGTITANSADDWVVIDVNQTTGEVLIMPKTVSEVALRLDGLDGYNNAIRAINAVASIYKNPTYATSARGLTVEDVNKLTGYTPNGENKLYSWSHKYGMDSNLNITGSGESTEKNQEYVSTAETQYYYYSANDALGSNLNCWLASRFVDPSARECNFGLRCFGEGEKFMFQRGGVLYGRDFFDIESDGTTCDQTDRESRLIIPVVSLRSDIGLESSSQFYTETATATVSVQEQDATHTFEHNVWTLK